MSEIAIPRLILGGMASGVGKTTLATGLMAALIARGLRVQPFKVGPDYLDPTYHRAATGRPSYNLDTWLTGVEATFRRFTASARDADIAVVEGVMGLFDGRKDTCDTASTAEVARLLAAPVVLVVDVARMGQSAAAVVAGFARLDPRVRVAGVILNRVASADHERTVRGAIAAWTDVPVLGAVPPDAALALPTRHLGLVPAPEARVEIAALGEVVARYVDVDTLLALARGAGPLPEAEGVAPEPPSERLPRPRDARMRLGLALDEAFSFYYPEALTALAEMGVAVVPFSPLAESDLPPDVDALYFGGGYPEVFAARLAANVSMLRATRRAAESGLPIYAECGGLMYLGETCRDAAGTEHALVGALPVRTAMGEARAQLGYRSVEMLRDTLLGRQGTRLRGHEFHWSRLLDPVPPERAAYCIEEQPERVEGFATEMLLASYVHVPLGAQPEALAWFVARCLACRARRGVPRRVLP